MDKPNAMIILAQKMREKNGKDAPPSDDVSQPDDMGADDSKATHGKVAANAMKSLGSAMDMHDYSKAYDVLCDLIEMHQMKDEEESSAGEPSKDEGGDDMGASSDSGSY